MDENRFEALARELAQRDRAVAASLAEARAAAAELRRHAEHAVATFCAAARAQGAEHLTELHVGPVEPDEKHVDCWQFKVNRGRWEIVCVAKPRGAVTLVGPYRRGKPEHPCRDYPLPSEAAHAGLADLLLDLIRQASAR
jgi:hypothetical protein